MSRLEETITNGPIVPQQIEVSKSLLHFFTARHERSISLCYLGAYRAHECHSLGRSESFSLGLPDRCKSVSASSLASNRFPFLRPVLFTVDHYLPRNCLSLLLPILILAYRIDRLTVYSR
jgi:hypothetical protein